MKKILNMFFVIVIFFVTSAIAQAVGADNSEHVQGIKISNSLFSFVLPYETKGTFFVRKQRDGIFIYHIESDKAGFGGFAFGVKAYKNPADHATMPGSRKIGELVDKKGTLYDMVLIQPTDVQYDYTKEAPQSYITLYDLNEKVYITGKKNTKYVKNQGMKGEDLYKEVLAKHVKAIKEKWDSTKLEQENMSYMYNVLRASNKNVLAKVGYAYYDTNADGVDELLIGEIVDGSLKGIIYDMYTMVDRKPKHVVSGGSRNRYFICDDYFICNEYSSGAKESGWRVYILEENSTELYPQVFFKYDAYENSKKPWFISYASGNTWENVSQKFFKERRQVFERYNRLDYKPLSDFNY